MSSEEEETQELEPSFWAVSSYGVKVRGPTATSTTDFREAKPGETELEDPASNPSSRPGTKGGKRPNRPGSGGSNPVQTLGTSGWSRSISAELEAAEQAKASENKPMGLQLYDVPFPWFHPTAISEEVYEDGKYEFLVAVGCIGQIGFIDADFRKEREKLAQHWVNRNNIGRSWILHSNGYFANGNKCTPVSRHARFAPRDRLRIVLDLYRETATFFLDTGVQRELGSMAEIDRAVRLGFQMYYKQDSITLLSCLDRSGEVEGAVKAASQRRRAERYEAKAAACKDEEEAAEWRSRASRCLQTAQALEAA